MTQKSAILSNVYL